MRLVFPCCYDCSSELEDEGLRRSLLYLSPVVLIVHVQGVGMVGEAVEQASHERLGAEDLGLFVEGLVAGDNDRAALVALAEDLEEQLCARL